MDDRFRREYMGDWDWDSGPRLRGRPLDVDFLGFRSDTYALQRAGWQISEERSHYDDDIRIAIRHPGHHISGMSRGIPRDHLISWANRYGRNHIHDRPLVLHFELAIRYVIRTHTDHPPLFIPVDATPRYEKALCERDLYDMPYFRPIDEGKEIFLRKASVDEIMQIALDKQEPEQARIRAARQAESKREDYKRGGTTKAKLIMVG